MLKTQHFDPSPGNLEKDPGYMYWNQVLGCVGRILSKVPCFLLELDGNLNDAGGSWKRRNIGREP